MNRAVYLEAREKASSEIRRQQKIVADLDERYIAENAKFKPGEKVIITDGKESRVSLVVGNRLDYNLTILPVLKKIKKDGTPSMINDTIWGREKIEKYVESPNL